MCRGECETLLTAARSSRSGKISTMDILECKRCTGEIKKHVTCDASIFLKKKYFNFLFFFFLPAEEAMPCRGPEAKSNFSRSIDG